METALLHQLQIINSSNQIKAQRKSFASISVTIGYDFKTLQIANDIFIEDSFSRKLLIISFVLFGQRILLALFLWHVCLSMNLLESLISSISYYTYCRMDLCFGLLE